MDSFHHWTPQWNFLCHTWLLKLKTVDLCPIHTCSGTPEVFQPRPVDRIAGLRPCRVFSQTSSLLRHLSRTGLLGSGRDSPGLSEPPLQRSWRYILSRACFLAPIQAHNERSLYPPQPGATRSTLFTLLPFTHSSCSSPNDAGPGYWWSKAGREPFTLSGRTSIQAIFCLLKLNSITLRT